MTASPFDSPAAARALEAAGIEPAQAEAITAPLRAAAGTGHGALTTKTDLPALRSEVRWMFGFQAALILAIAARRFGLA